MSILIAAIWMSLMLGVAESSSPREARFAAAQAWPPGQASVKAQHVFPLGTCTKTRLFNTYTHIYTAAHPDQHTGTHPAPMASSCSTLWLSKMKVCSRNIYVQHPCSVKLSGSQAQTFNLPSSCAWVPVSPVLAPVYTSPEIIDPLQLLVQTSLCTPTHTQCRTIQ